MTTSRFLSFVDHKEPKRDTCRCFKIHIATYFSFPVGQKQIGNEIYSSQDSLDTERQKICSRFATAVQMGLGNGAFWIAHTKRRLDDLWCDVQIGLVTDPQLAHLIVVALKKPRTIEGESFRSGHRKDHNTLYISFEEVLEGSVTHPRAQQYSQTVVVHEMGHYLDLGDHPCKGPGVVPNSDEEYGLKSGTPEQKANFMGVGNRIYDQHAVRFKDALVSTLPPYLPPHKKTAFGFAAKNATDSGGGDRHTRPWLGTAWEPLINRITSD